MFPDFMVIENRGMSILTALVIFFAGIGVTAGLQLLKRELDNVNEKINDEVERLDKAVEATNKRADTHQEKLESVRDDMSEMKTNIALLLSATTRIEDYLKENRRNV